MQTSTKLVQEVLHDVYIDRGDFEGKIVRVMDKLRAIAEEHGEDVLIDWSRDYDGEFCPRVVRMRPENKYEIAEREADNLRMQEYRRREYEKLKKEFEGVQN